MSDLHKNELHSQIQYRTVEELAASEGRYKELIELLHVVVFNCDKEGRLVFLSPAWTEILGQPLSDSLKRHITDFIYRDDKELWVSLFIKQQKMIIKHKELRFCHRNGDVIWFELSARINKNGDTVGLLYDITDRKRLEEEKNMLQIKMITASKLASLGEIATGMAHEINQPLTYINSFVHRLLRNLEDDAIDKTELKHELKVSSNQIDRISNIINHLMTFGRRDDMEKQQVSIETILNNTLLLMGELIRLRNIEMKRDIEPDLPEVSGNPIQLEQVFINLFQNAIDSFPKKTKVFSVINVNVSLSNDKKSVVIKVKDNGIGIKHENLNRIFEPFFTTKEVGKDTGLGLSIVYGIINEHNGKIICESEEGKGSTFTITLPVFPSFLSSSLGT